MKYIISLIILLNIFDFAHSAYIFKYKGWVDIKKASSKEWTRLEGDSRINLASGDEIRTKRASVCEINMDDGSKVTIAPMSVFKLANETKESASLGLFVGRMRSWVKRFTKKYEVRTPTAVCAVRGTDFITSADETGNTRIEVYDGSVLAADASGNTTLVRPGEFTEIFRDMPLRPPETNPNPPAGMESAIGDSKMLSKMEIYNEISKEDVIQRAQAEIQSSEYQNRKVAIDAFGYRVRMEEYITRPSADSFKYVVLNTRANRFDFGKILFTFNKDLPEDLTLATKNMTYATGATAPEWYLTAMNSVMSNTKDKVTEDAFDGHMVPDNALNPSEWNLFFTNYAFYVQGGDEPVENNGMGKKLWSYTDSDLNNVIATGEFRFLEDRVLLNTEKTSDYQTKYNFTDGSSMMATKINPLGDNVFDNIVRNEYSGGTWINTRDFVLFDSGKIVSTEDLASGLGGANKDTLTDMLNFERVYTSSLFNGRKIDLEFSAKLLKDAGLLNFE